MELTLKENQEFESRNAALQEKLKEKCSEKNSLVLQADELRVTLQNVEAQNATLQETVEDLQKEVEQLKNFAPIQSKKSFGGFSTPNVNGFSVGDISVDDPQFSPFKDSGGGGEVIGNNLILDLREDLAKLTEDLDREKELRNLEIEKSDFLVERVSALEGENESQKSEIEKLTKSKVLEIENLKSELSREKEVLKLEVERNQNLTETVSELKREKEEKEMEVQQISERIEMKTEEIETLSSELNGERESLKLKLEENQILLDKISNLEKEKEEREFELMQVSEMSERKTEEIANLSSELNSEKEQLKLQKEKDQILVETISELEKQREEKEFELKQVSELSERKNEEIQQLSSEFKSEKEKLKSELERNVAGLQERLSEVESENESDKQKIEELIGLFQSKNSETESLASELIREKEISNSEVEKNWALAEKVSTLNSQIESQEVTIKQQSDLMQSQTQHFEQITEKLTSELNIETEKNQVLAGKISDLKNQVKARECDAEKLTDMLHEKALEFDKLTVEYEKECGEIRSDLMSSFEEQFQKQKEEFELELRQNEEVQKSKISDLEKKNVDFKSKSETLYASLTDVMTEFSECRKKLEELQESAKRDDALKDEIEHENELATTEHISQLEIKVESLSSALQSKSEEFKEKERKFEELTNQHRIVLSKLEENHKKTIEEMRETFVKIIDNLEEKIRQKDQEIGQLRGKIENSSENSESDFEKRCQEITEECTKSKESALKEQKSRYEARLKHITDKVQSQYKSEIEKSVAKWTADLRSKDNKISEIKTLLTTAEAEKSDLKKEVQTVGEKYNLAKQKLVEIHGGFESKANVLTHDRDQLSAKYANAKKAIVQMQEQVKKRESQMESLKMVNEQLRRELTQLKSVTQVVKSAASSSSTSSDGFKHPGALMPHTPGNLYYLKSH